MNIPSGSHGALPLGGDMKGSQLWRAAPLALALVGPAALAQDTAVVNGTTFVCEHTCEVSTGRYGTVVYDSGGGYIYKRLPSSQ